MCDVRNLLWFGHRGFCCEIRDCKADITIYLDRNTLGIIAYEYKINQFVFLPNKKKNTQPNSFHNFMEVLFLIFRMFVWTWYASLCDIYEYIHTSMRMRIREFLSLAICHYAAGTSTSTCYLGVAKSTQPFQMIAFCFLDSLKIETAVDWACVCVCIHRELDWFRAQTESHISELEQSQHCRRKT